MKKILAIVLALALSISLCAVFATAEEETAKIEKIEFASATEGVVTSHPRKDGTLDVLIDGDVLEGTKAFDTKGVVLFCNTHCKTAGEYPEFSLILTLDKKATVSGVTVALYEEYNSMIGTPKDQKVTVEYGDTAESLTLLGDLNLGCADANAEWAENKKDPKVENCEVNFDSVVEAKVIKLTFAYGACPEGFADAKVIWEWIGLTEVGVNTASATVDESSADAAESSAASTESSTAATESSTAAAESSTAPATSTEKPAPTSDSGIAALAVISVLAVAGVVVVKKSR